MHLSTAQITLAPDTSIDLQLHTINSDGTWTPEALIDDLIGENFGLAAITDHDRVDTLVELQQLALRKKFPLLVATEMTSAWKGKPVDVLCYGFDPEKNELSALADDILRRQQENTRTVYENLCRNGIAFDEADLLAILQKPGSSHPPALAAVLKKNGHEDGWTPIIKAGVRFARVDIAAVVEAAHRSGGVALIAHPGRGDGYMCFDADLLDELRKEVPIDGFEVYYPLHKPEQVTLYSEYAQKHNLLTSSGSDSHGPDKKPIKYPAHLSRNLLARLGIEIA